MPVNEKLVVIVRLKYKQKCSAHTPYQSGIPISKGGGRERFFFQTETKPLSEEAIAAHSPLFLKPYPRLVAKDLGALPARMGKVSWSVQYTQIVLE